MVHKCFPPNIDDFPDEKVKKLKYECKAHMQICALLSQLHRHNDAVTHADAAIKLSHFLIKDMFNLVCHYSKRCPTVT